MVGNTRTGKKKAPKKTPPTPETPSHATPANDLQSSLASSNSPTKDTPSKERTPQKTSPQTPNSSKKTPQNTRKDRPSTLKLVSDAILNLEAQLQTLEGVEGLEKDLLVNALKAFTHTVKEVSKHLYSEDTKQSELRRELEDEKDEQRQSGLKGRFIITSPAKGENLVGNADRFKDDNTGAGAVQHAIKLAKDKYKVDIPEGEISTCYALKKGGMVLGLCHLGRGSAFQRLVSAIKSNKDVDNSKNVYFNFMLTQKRNELLFKVRELKRIEDGKVKKFYSDEYGNITVVTKDGDKERVTYAHETKKTFSVEELLGKYQ